MFSTVCTWYLHVALAAFVPMSWERFPFGHSCNYSVRCCPRMYQHEINTFGYFFYLFPGTASCFQKLRRCFITFSLFIWKQFMNLTPLLGKEWLLWATLYIWTPPLHFQRGLYFTGNNQWWMIDGWCSALNVIYTERVDLIWTREVLMLAGGYVQTFIQSRYYR